MIEGVPRRESFRQFVYLLQSLFFFFKLSARPDGCRAPGICVTLSVSSSTLLLSRHNATATTCLPAWCPGCRLSRRAPPCRADVSSVGEDPCSACFKSSAFGLAARKHHVQPTSYCCRGSLVSLIHAFCLGHNQSAPLLPEAHQPPSWK